LVAITTWSRGMVFSALPTTPCGAVGRRGVDEVDAQPDGFMNEPRAFVFGLAGLEAETGKAAGAEACDADAEAGAAESRVVHMRLSCFNCGL